MGWFCKKVKEVVQEKPKEVRKTKIDYGPPQKFNIGRVAVKLSIRDGEEFTTFFYGTFSQYIDWGHDEDSYNKTPKEPTAWAVHISSATDMARQFMADLPIDDRTYVNDDRNVTASVRSYVTATKFLYNEDYFEEYAVAKVVPV